MWIYIFLGILLIFTIYKERQALGCPDIPNGKDCDNQNGKALKGTKINEGDSTNKILNTLEYAADYENRWVRWRSYFIVALLATILIVYIIYDRIPYEHEMIIYLIVIMLILMALNSFYKFHLTKIVHNNISKGVSILRKRFNNHKA